MTLAAPRPLRARGCGRRLTRRLRRETGHEHVFEVVQLGQRPRHARNRDRCRTVLERMPSVDDKRRPTAHQASTNTPIAQQPSINAAFSECAHTNANNTENTNANNATFAMAQAQDEYYQYLLTTSAYALQHISVEGRNCLMGPGFHPCICGLTNRPNDGYRSRSAWVAIYNREACVELIAKERKMAHPRHGIQDGHRVQRNR